MRSPDTSDRDVQRLQPAGQRWGFGAHTVVPYLAHIASAGASPGAGDAAIRNPVFPHMEAATRTMRRSH